MQTRPDRNFDLMVSYYDLKVADQDAVVILEKTLIREDSLAELFSGSTLKLEMKNDIYSTYRLQAPPHLNGMLPH